MVPHLSQSNCLRDKEWQVDLQELCSAIIVQYSAGEHIVRVLTQTQLLFVPKYTIVQNKMMRCCGSAPPLCDNLPKKRAILIHLKAKLSESSVHV